MDRSQARYAFRIEPHEHPRQAGRANDVLASRRETIELDDKTSHTVTLFFREPRENLAKLRAKGQADSARETARHLKALLVAQGKDPQKIDESLKMIKANNRATDRGARDILRRQQSEKNVRLQRQRSFAQIATGKLQASQSRPGDPNDIPYGVVDGMLADAMEKGQVLRVDSRLRRSAYSRTLTRPELTNPVDRPVHLKHSDKVPLRTGTDGDDMPSKPAATRKPLPTIPPMLGKGRSRSAGGAARRSKPLPPQPVKPARKEDVPAAPADGPASTTDRS